MPINLVGEAIEVHHGDGLVEQQLFSLAVRARPADIPSSLEVDISELTIGSSLRVSDLALPSGVTTEIDPETSIVTGFPGRTAVAETTEEDGEPTEATAAPAEAAADEG